MISRLGGEVESVSENRVELRCGDVVYEVLVPSYLEERLRPRLGQRVELFVKHYLEGGPALSAFLPRLVGFENEAERDFYNLLVKVPGLGAKSALKCLVIPPGQVARAIEQEDKRSLAGLPGVGGRTAEKIIAALRGKAADFAAPAAEKRPAAAREEPEEEAVAVLMKLAYRRAEAEELIRRVRKKYPEVSGTEEIVQAVLKDVGSGVVR